MKERILLRRFFRHVFSSVNLFVCLFVLLQESLKGKGCDEGAPKLVLIELLSHERFSLNNHQGSGGAREVRRVAKRKN